MPPKPSIEAKKSKDLLTVKEIASRDHCSEKTVRRAIESGALEAVRIGSSMRLVRIHPDAHEAYRKRQLP